MKYLVIGATPGGRQRKEFAVTVFAKSKRSVEEELREHLGIEAHSEQEFMDILKELGFTVAKAQDNNDDMVRIPINMMEGSIFEKS